MGRLSTRFVAGGMLGATLLGAAGAPVLGIAPGRAAPLEGIENAGPWTCESGPEFDEGPGLFTRFDPVSARFIAGALLSAQETALGIRSDQAQAWRNYTNALVDLLPSGKRIARWADKPKRESAEAFDLAQDLAAGAMERAEKAKRLREAIDALKAELSPDQLRTAQQMQAALVERIIRFVEWRRGESFDVPR